jgi:hypothetical protein
MVTGSKGRASDDITTKSQGELFLQMKIEKEHDLTEKRSKKN